MKEQFFNLVSVWECEKPELKKMRFKKESHLTLTS